MASHFGLLLLFAIFVSAVFAALMRESPRAQLELGATLCGGFVGAGLVLGWLLYPLPL